jgi:pilus assembly protein CpaB
MARKRVYTVFFVAAFVGAIFAFSTYRYVQAIPARTIAVATTPVVVAAGNLNLGAALRAEDLRKVDWPSQAVPAGVFTSTEELVGRGLIQGVSQNEPILPAKLAPVGAGAGLPPIIPDGMRALSVRVNDVIGVAGYVLPGTKVDVLVTVSPTQQVQDMTSKVILTNVLVLAAGTRIERDAEKDEPISVSVVTLLVDPVQAEALTLASTEGKIQLALRNPLDATRPATPGIRPAALLGRSAAAPAPRARVVAAAPRPAAAPPVPAPAKPEAFPTIEIIRGDKRAQEAVRQE